MSRRKPVLFAGGISNMGASLICGDISNDGACFAGCRRKPILSSDRRVSGDLTFFADTYRKNNALAGEVSSKGAYPESQKVGGKAKASAAMAFVFLGLTTRRFLCRGVNDDGACFDGCRLYGRGG